MTRAVIRPAMDKPGGAWPTVPNAKRAANLETRRLIPAVMLHKDESLCLTRTKPPSPTHLKKIITD